MLGKAMMIQHNDSDTSCMRALALLERTFASEAELPPHYRHTSKSQCQHYHIAPCAAQHVLLGLCITMCQMGAVPHVLLHAWYSAV